MDEKGIQSKISEGIFDAISNTAKNREEYYKTNKAPTLYEAKDIVSRFGNTNAVISGGTGLIPGPFGMAAAIPEIVLVLRNQINMIYDIGKAHGKEKAMTKELMVGILLGSVGSGAGSFLTIQAGKVMSKRVGAKALQNLITILGGKITQTVIKSMAAKWIPIAGAVAMASWSKYSTHKIGEKAIEIFSKDIIIVEEELLDIPEEMKKEAPILSIEQNNSLIIAKVELLINLMNIDNYKHEKEISYLKEYINSLAIGDLVKGKLLMSLSKVEQINVDHTQFTNTRNDALSVILDMIALAKKDGQFHPKEESYIKEVALKLGFSSEELSFLL